MLRARLGAALGLALIAVPAAAADRTMGVATCAGSACHGAARMAGAAVRRDEYLTWQRHERHARAYATLRSERARRIAENLGLGAATEARECLACHADAVPKAQRGERFQLADGVGCETCHGPAERWLTPHARGYKTHRDRLAHGLYPTWEPQARAELCLSCHQGDARRPMTHAIMGAGHPPLLFELDTFGTLQPAHFEADADYVARKGRQDSARHWAVGQAVAARLLLSGIGSAGLGGDGLFPELVWFDCNACHHPMQPPRWAAGQGTGLPPGRVRLADSSLHLIGVWLDVVKPELAARWRAAVGQVHTATQRTAAEVKQHAAVAQTLLVDEILPLANRHDHGRPQVRALTLALLDAGAGPRAADFSSAEQTTMALAVLATQLAQGGKTPKPLREAIDAVYAAVEKREAYDPEKMRAALAATRAQILKSYPL